jgi:hypothetical protein
MQASHGSWICCFLCVSLCLHLPCVHLPYGIHY